MARPRKEDPGSPISVRIPDSLMDQLKLAAKLMDKSVHEAMREAMRIGLEDLKRIDYNVAGSVVDRAKPKTDEQDIAMLAEKGGGYSVKKARCAIAPLKVPTSFFVVQRKGKPAPDR